MAESQLLLARYRSLTKALRICLSACLLGLVCLVSQASAQITIDFQHDDNGFFDNPTARASLEAAVGDINAVLNSNLSAVTDMTVGNSGNATATFDFEYRYTNPTTLAPEVIADTSFAANEFRLFVGSQSLNGNTLGQGGPGSAGISGTLSGAVADRQAAINDAQANDTHRRGDGPVISTLAGAFPNDGETFSFDIGSAVGNLWFDTDTDWQFDHTIDVEAGKSDFYSVALHETLHSIGFGTSDTWNSLIGSADGTDFDWLGAEVIAANGGSGDGVIFGGDQAHFAEGLMSARISDGVLQEVVMDPTLTVGTRKGLTELDVAALRDFGFVNASAVPEPTGVLVLASIGLIITSRRRRTA